MRTHRFEPVSLVFGLVFAAMGLWFLRGDADVWRINWSWFWPVVLTVGGLLVLLSARPSRRERDDDAAAADDDGAATVSDPGTG